jgi:hypothetical protein
MGKRTLLALMSCAVLAAAIALPASASGKQPLLIGNCLKAKFKPPTLIFSCGDASMGAKDVVWSSWSGKSASGSGTGLLNDCTPTCADGKTHTAPISVTASKPVTCKKTGKRIFSRLSWSWTSGASPVANNPAQGSVPVGCKLASL